MGIGEIKSISFNYSTVYNMVCELIKLISTPYFLCLILGDKNEPIRYNGINNKQYAISK